MLPSHTLFLFNFLISIHVIRETGGIQLIPERLATALIECLIYMQKVSDFIPVTCKVGCKRLIENSGKSLFHMVWTNGQDLSKAAPPPPIHVRAILQQQKGITFEEPQ